MTDIANPVARRAFVTGFGVGAAALGAGLASCATAEEAAKPPTVAAPARWQAASEAKDAWMNVPSRHRMVFDAPNDKDAVGAIATANTFIELNTSDYGLAPSDISVIIVLRHDATPYAYTDAMWAKYGAIFAKVDKLKDSKAKGKPAMRNVLEAGDIKDLANRGLTLTALTKKNVRYAVCGMATERFAGMIAKKTKADAKVVKAELAAHLIPNAHMMASGIVALNRAQEHGYAALPAG